MKPSSRHSLFNSSLMTSCSVACLATAALVGGASPLLAQEPAIVLDPVIVEGQAAEPGYGVGGTVEAEGVVAKRGTVGTKTDTPLAKVPQSISVVTKEELEARNVQTLSQALTYTPGVRTGAFGFDPRFDSFYIRGFSVVYTGVYRDGLRELTGNFSIFKTEPYGLEAISVLKGPSSVLYGAGSAGGIVNLVSKRPTEEPFHEVEAQIGNNDRYQAQFDISGPVAGNDNVLYRLTGVFREADTQNISVPDDRVFIAPALTLRSDDRRTHITFLGEYSDITTGGNATNFFDFANREVTDLISGDPAFGDFDQQQARIGYAFEHEFNDALTLRQNLRYAHIDADVKYTSITGISPDRRFATRSTGRVTDDLDSFVVDTHLQGNVDTGSVQHTLLGGIDYAYVDVNDKIGLGTAPDLNLVTLNYGEQDIEAPPYNFRDVTTRQHQTGIYLQDQMEFNRFIFTLGGRYDWFENEDVDLQDALNNASQDGSQFSGRVGLGYETEIGLTPYVSYATSFNPVIGRGFNGQPFEPIEAAQTEVGVKYTPDYANFSVNAALFQIDQKNGLTPDPDNLGFQVQRGEIRSRGFELETRASLATGFDVIAAYTYLDLEIVEGSNADNAPSGIPSHQFSLWGDYTVQSGPVEGLGIGAGLRYLGESFGDDENTFENDHRLLVDAALRYDLGRINPNLEGAEAAINATNLFDEQGTSCQAGFCYLDEGRSVIGSLRYRF